MRVNQTYCLAGESGDFNGPPSRGPIDQAFTLAMITLGLGVGLSSCQQKIVNDAAIRTGRMPPPKQTTKEEISPAIASLQHPPRFNLGRELDRQYPPLPQEVSDEVKIELHRPQVDQPVIIDVPRVATIQEAFPGYTPGKKY